MDLADTIREKYGRTIESIANTAQGCGRTVSEVKLVVVSKGQPTQILEAAVEAGIRVFGENYPEEAVEKINFFHNLTNLEWHMIGHLQSRKARIIVESFDCLQSLDSLHLAEKLNQLLIPLQKTMPVLLEMNVSGEESKSGWPAWEEAQWKELVPVVNQIADFQQLNIVGLMCMPPLFDDPELARPYFTRLRRLKDFLRMAVKASVWTELSMGTSADYKVAVEEGATFVRVGQAIFRPAASKKGIMTK